MIKGFSTETEPEIGILGPQGDYALNYTSATEIELAQIAPVGG